MVILNVYSSPHFNLKGISFILLHLLFSFYKYNNTLFLIGRTNSIDSHFRKPAAGIISGISSGISGISSGISGIGSGIGGIFSKLGAQKPNDKDANQKQINDVGPSLPFD